MPTVYPCVHGHEIVGRVTKVGAAVTKFRPGDHAAVGCLVDSDGNCTECRAGLEQFCPRIVVIAARTKDPGDIVDSVICHMNESEEGEQPPLNLFD